MDRVRLAFPTGTATLTNVTLARNLVGGSTNHTIHLVAIAKAAGVVIDWEDFSELSAAVPLLARVYPNGIADVNHFHAAGGLGFVIGQLLDADLLHDDVQTILGPGLHNFCREPFLDKGALEWREAPAQTLDADIVRPVSDPFDREGGLRLVAGNVGRAIVKVSAVAPQHRSIEAPARVFASQSAFTKAFNDGELEMDFVAVLPGQGPRANGMPELHKLTPYLGILQDRGFKVALVTDGRMSGASGKVISAIHVSPEAAAGGALARLATGSVHLLAGQQFAVPEHHDLPADGFHVGQQVGRQDDPQPLVAGQVADQFEDGDPFKTITGGSCKLDQPADKFKCKLRKEKQEPPLKPDYKYGVTVHFVEDDTPKTCERDPRVYLMR